MSVVEVPIVGSNRTITIDAYKSRSLQKQEKNNNNNSVASEVDNLLTLMCEQQPKIQMNAKVVTINNNNKHNNENLENKVEENLIKLDIETEEESEIEYIKNNFETIESTNKEMRSTEESYN